MENTNESNRSYRVLEIAKGATLTEIRAAYLEKTSQKKFTKVFIHDESVIDEFKRYHAAYVYIVKDFAESENISDLSLYPPDQAFRMIVNQGIYYLINYNYIKAGEKFQEAYTMNRDSEEVLIYLGLLLLKRKNYYAAEKYFLDVVKRNKENEDAWILLGETYLKAGNERKALVMFETAKKLNPLRPEILEMMKPLMEKKQPGPRKSSFFKDILDRFKK